jgi:membrane dipeptidase
VYKRQTRTPDDVRVARAAGRVGAILGVEGGDFLQDDLGRVERCFADGVRVLTLVHYFRGGVIGDVMTAPPVHGGLTPFGRDVVREMNRVGLVVDLSHCSERTAYDALEVATKPLLITHTDVAEGGPDHARFVSEGLARAVAQAGGAVGAWPAGIRLGSLDDYVERIVALVELLGEDHVCIGTDMDANYKPVFETYTKMPLVVGGLLRRGLSEPAAAKVIGGNFLRVFAAALTGAD